MDLAELKPDMDERFGYVDQRFARVDDRFQELIDLILSEGEKTRRRFEISGRGSAPLIDSVRDAAIHTDDHYQEFSLAGSIARERHQQRRRGQPDQHK
jgi:hypothetical protein